MWRAMPPHLLRPCRAGASSKSTWVEKLTQKAGLQAVRDFHTRDLSSRSQQAGEVRALAGGLAG